MRIIIIDGESSDMIEYSRANRFPFYTREKSVSIQFDDYEDIYELDFIYGKIVEKYPQLNAEEFYGTMYEI